MVDPQAGVTTDSPPVTETPEFKTALKAERERLEANIRESNQQHLAKREAELEAQIRARHPSAEEPAPSSGEGYFESWGAKHGLPPEAGRELAQGIVGHVQAALLAPITATQKRQEIRNQRQELRATNPKLAKLDDQFSAEATKMVEALRPDLIGPDSYAKALHMVIGSHIEELTETPPPAEPVREIVPGVEPTGSAPAPKKKVSLNTEQKRFIEERGMDEESFVEMMRGRAQALEAKGFTKVQVRARLGTNLGAIDF